MKDFPHMTYTTTDLQTSATGTPSTNQKLSPGTLHKLGKGPVG